MTREDFVRQYMTDENPDWIWGRKAAERAAELAERAGLAWDPPTTEQLDGVLAGQPPPAEPEVIWQKADLRFTSDGRWWWEEEAGSGKWDPYEWSSLWTGQREAVAELSRRLLAERDGTCPAEADVVHLSRNIWADIADRLKNPLLFVKRGPDGDLESVEVLREPAPAHPTFRQMALVLGRLEAAYLAAQEAGVQAGSLERREGDVKGEVKWPYGYDRPPAALVVLIEARVPAGREESDGQ